MGCHSLLQRTFLTQGLNSRLLHWKQILFCLSHQESSESESRSVVANPLQPHGLYSPWNSPGQKTGVGSRSLLQGIFPTQQLNPSLLHCRWILCQLSYQGRHTFWLRIDKKLCRDHHTKSCLDLCMTTNCVTQNAWQSIAYTHRSYMW